MIKIGLLGFGKTGKAVASVIVQDSRFDLQWVYRRGKKLHKALVVDYLDIEVQDDSEIISAQKKSLKTLLDAQPVDMIIDFSSAELIQEYGEYAAQKGISIVSAVSHYNEADLDFIQQLGTKTRIFWSPNITFGVNYIMYAAKFLQKINPYVDIEIVEEHFRDKDGVSGTARKMAEILDLKNNQINSIRVGGIVGKHEIIFGFPHQTMRFVHESISRDAFGNGALFAAKKLLAKPIGYYKYEDFLQEYFMEK